MGLELLKFLGYAGIILRSSSSLLFARIMDFEQVLKFETIKHEKPLFLKILSVIAIPFALHSHRKLNSVQHCASNMSAIRLLNIQFKLYVRYLILLIVILLYGAGGRYHPKQMEGNILAKAAQLPKVIFTL